MTNTAALRALLRLSPVLFTLPAACASEAPVESARESPSASVAALGPAHAHTEQGCGDHEAEETPGDRAAAARRIEWRHRQHKPERTVELKVLGFNDFHGQLSQGRLVSGRPAGGAAVLAAYLRAAARGFETRSLILHAGDHVGASPPASALLQDEPSIAFLNLLGNEHCSYRHRDHVRCNLLGTLGNHEFDEGTDEMLRLIRGGNHANGPFLEARYRGARFPYVSANVVEAESERPILPPYAVKSLAGVKVGLIGAVLKETPTIVTPTGVAGLSFLDEASAINRYVRKLRWQGVRTIIVSIHQGGPQASYSGATQPGGAVAGVINDIVRNLDDEVDLVVSGHAHSFTNVLLPNQNGTPILVTQAFSASTAYADIALSVDRRSGDVTAKSAEIVTTYSDVAPGNAPAADVAELVASAEALTAPLVNRVVAESSTALTRTQNTAGESSLGNLIADAQRAALGADFAFMNPGGIRADLDIGPVTWGELFTVQPFGNSLVRLTLTGAQIVDLLEQQWLDQPFARIIAVSGLSYSWNPALPEGQRVVQVLRGGAPLDLSASYTVAVNSFIAAGGDNFTVLAQGTDRVGGPVDLDALIDYLTDLPQPFTAAIEGRITLSN